MNGYPFVAITLLAALTGCAVLDTKSDPSRFYVLEYASAPAEVPASAPAPWPFALAVARVRLPDYLDRPQVVTRTEQRRVTFSEFHRWPEQLDKGATRLLADSLAARLHANRVVREPALDVHRDGVLVQLDALRYDGDLGGSVTLRARWRASTIHSGETLVSGERTVSVETQDSGYDAYTAAMAAAMDKFAEEISVELRASVRASSTGLPIPVASAAPSLSR